MFNSLPLRRASIAALSLVVFAMQWIGLAHRSAHAPLPRAATQAAQPELWLSIANGETVSSDQWHAQSQSTPLTAQRAVANNDPWHLHTSDTDCAHFDALCAASAVVASLAPVALVKRDHVESSRAYLATLVARTPRAHARAPPLA